MGNILCSCNVLHHDLCEFARFRLKIAKLTFPSGWWLYSFLANILGRSNILVQLYDDLHLPNHVFWMEIAQEDQICQAS